MTSPPATPPREVSLYAEDWRFEGIIADCEWSEEYRPGGFHPVTLGDTFHDGRYKAIRKLGEGSYSTVWLVASTSIPRYAALKIMTAQSFTASTELTILDHLSNSAPEDPNARHITKLLDRFRHEGPNGCHQCLVFELMGASAASLVEDLPESNPKLWGVPQRYPITVAKTIFLHTLHGLEFLHKNGVVHGDLQPGNLLFSIENLDEVDQQQLEQNETNTAIPLRRIDGKIDRWAPRSVYQRQTLHDRIKLDTDFSVKLSDFGAAFFMSDPPESSIIPKGLRSPELILKRPFSHGIDIWSFGCLMHEFLTSEPLFTVMTCGYDQEHRDKADDDHLVQFNDKIRPLSESVMRSWPRKDQWYDLYHKQLCNFEPYKSLEQRFAKNKHPDIDDEEAAVICQLIRDILVYDPAERPSAAELLKHPWFSE